MPASSPGARPRAARPRSRASRAQRISIRSTISAQSCASVPPAPALTRDERVARVVGPGEQPLLLEREQPRLDRGELLLELARELLVLLGQLGERLEVLDVGVDAAEALQAARHARVLGADLRRALGVVPEARARPSASRARATRSASAAGSKIVREQLQLVADRRKPLPASAPRIAAAPSCAVAALELLARAAPARVVAAELLVGVETRRCSTVRRRSSRRLAGVACGRRRRRLPRSRRRPSSAPPEE